MESPANGPSVWCDSLEGLGFSERAQRPGKELQQTHIFQFSKFITNLLPEKLRGKDGMFDPPGGLGIVGLGDCETERLYVSRCSK